MKILDAHILFKQNHLATQIDFGIITLTCLSKQAKIKITSVSRYYDEAKDETGMCCSLASGMDIFPECQYDLTKEDLMSPNLVAEIQLNPNYLSDFVKADLYIKINGMKGIIHLKLV